jgi:hypothetical protein
VGALAVSAMGSEHLVHLPARRLALGGLGTPGPPSTPYNVKITSNRRFRICEQERLDAARSSRRARVVDALWHPWLRINRALRVMLQPRWSAASWSQVKTGFTKVLALTIKRGSSSSSLSTTPNGQFLLFCWSFLCSAIT